MSLDEIEGMTLSELSEKEFQHVALGIAANADLSLIRTQDQEAEFMLTDGEGFEWIVSRKLTAGLVFKLATVIQTGEEHPHGEFFRQRPFYDIDRRRAAANDND
jgi:hypothetical protein